MRDNQKRLNVYIPLELYAQVEESEYTTTEAVILGLQRLFSKDQDIHQDETEKLNYELVMSLIEDLKEQLRVKDSQIENKDRLLEAQAIQLQIVINQKAIEAPGIKKPWWKFW